MKAAIIHSYGAPEVVTLQEVPRPVVSDGDVLVRVKATSVTAADSRIRGARFPAGFGFLARLAFGPVTPRVKILGSTFSGVIEEVGKKVTQFQVGDEVAGMTGIQMGTHAEYVKVSSLKSITHKPASVSHQDAAGMLFGGTAALYFIRDILKVQSGQTVLINGASGAVGTNAVQLARYYGATVTGVTSGENAELVQQIGASSVIDYTKEKLSERKQTFDAVLDTVGTLSPRSARTLLTNQGRAGLMVPSLWDMMTARRPVFTGTATEKTADIAFLLSLVEKGDLKVIIDSTFSIDDIVAAHHKADSGKKVGNIIVQI